MLIPFGVNSQLNLIQQFGLSGESGTTEFNDIIYGSDGFIYLISSSSANGLDGNINVTSFGSSYIIVTKLNSDFDILWQNSYGGTGLEYNGAIKELSNGLLVSATSTSGVSGNKTTQNYGGSDGWVFKIDFDGDILWQSGFGGDDFDEIMNLIISPSEEIYLGIRSFSSISGNRSAQLKGDRDFWIVKINNNGDLIWDKSFGSNGDDAISDLTQLANGNIAAAGASLNGNISFDKTESPYSYLDTWLVCIDTSGIVLWDKTIGGDGAEKDGFLTSKGNDIFLLNTSSSGISGLRTEPLKGPEDLWVSKINDNGNIIWMNYYGGNDYDRASSIHVNQDMLVIDSYSLSNTSFDKTEDSRGERDFWMLITNLDGEVIIDKTIGGTQNDVSPKSIFNDTKILLAGSSTSDNSGDKTIPKFNTDPNSIEVWLVELDASTLNIVQTLDVQPAVYPNPVSDLLTIDLSSYHTLQSITIHNPLGKLVFKENFNSTNDHQSLQVDMTNYSSGVYTVQVIGDNVSKAVKVVR